ncbi:MAG: 50S ribosomal protein L3 N(5)-glutamine methyltransferase, partial [Rhodoplanes sp.]
MPLADTESRLTDLMTVRDWLRYGVSRFRSEQLVFGHGTSTAVDEAAFLILSALELPIDQLEPWLDCRLTEGERGRIAGLIDARVTTRKP